MNLLLPIYILPIYRLLNPVTEVRVRGHVRVLPEDGVVH
jgi:hypothetical protein